MVKILFDQSELLQYSLCIVLFYADNCHHCQTIKPKFEELEQEFGEEIQFFSAEINTIKELYDKYAETQEAFGYETDENGSPVKDDSGNFMTKKLLTAEGTPQLVPKYVIPNFYIFAQELSSDQDELGFAGGWDGGDPNELYAVLQALQTKALGG